MLFRILAVSIVICAAGSTDQAHAASEDAAQRELRSIERAVEHDRARRRALAEETQALTRQLEELRVEMVAAAEKVQRQEDAVTQIENELNALSAREKAAEEGLLRRRDQLIDTLGALQRLAHRPPEALLAMPASPIDTVRSALLLRAAVPPLEREARELRGWIAELTRLRHELAGKRERLGGALADLKRERAALAVLAERKALLRDRADAENRDVARRLESMAQEAEGLRDLLARLEAERRAAEEARRAAEAERRRAEADARRQRAADMAEAERQRTAALNARSAQRAEPPPSEPAPAPPPARMEEQEQKTAALATTAPTRPTVTRPFTGARGALILPARGRILHQFGEGQGARSRGVTVETRAGAQVVAPHDGQIAYAGPFRGYGLLLIIDHGQGYHSLLTGLSKLDGVLGQSVLAGEPVGIMGTPEDGRPILYVELRHKGQPINPLPWMAAQRG